MRNKEGAENDIYGKLFYHVRDLFENFILKLKRMKVHFELVPMKNQAARAIGKFDRIHVSHGLAISRNARGRR